MSGLPSGFTASRARFHESCRVERGGAASPWGLLIRFIFFFRHQPPEKQKAQSRIRLNLDYSGSTARASREAGQAHLHFLPFMRTWSLFSRLRSQDGLIWDGGSTPVFSPGASLLFLFPSVRLSVRWDVLRNIGAFLRPGSFQIGRNPCIKLAFSVTDIHVSHAANPQNKMAQSGWIEPHWLHGQGSNLQPAG